MINARTKAYLALIITSAIWGVAGPVIKATLSYLPPFTFLFYRFALVVVFTFPWYLFYLRKHPISKTDLIPLSILGFLATTVNLGLIFLGFERTTALDGTLLTAVTPIFIFLLGVIFLKEKVSQKEKLGVVLVITGSLMTVVQPMLEGKALAGQNSLGNFLILVAGVEWAIFVLWSKRSFSHFPPLLITLHSSVVAFLSFLPLSFFEIGPKFFQFSLLINNWPTLFGLAYMAYLSYLAAYFLYQYGMSQIKISQGSIFAYLIPVFATPVAVIFLKETLTIPFLIGALIIALGLHSTLNPNTQRYESKTS